VAGISLLRLLALGQTVPDWDERTIEQNLRTGDLSRAAESKTTRFGIVAQTDCAALLRSSRES
jgi:hypothetical protein